MAIVFREYADEDIEQIAALLNKVFANSPLSAEALRSWNGENFTIAVAENEGEIVGAIPMFKRKLLIGPHAELDAWMQFRVGVSERCRGMGIGKELQNAIGKMLKGRGDILLVVSTSERAKAYSFYRACGFYDVSYRKRFQFSPGSPEIHSEVSRLDETAFFASKKTWLDIFNECYAGYGGYPVRTMDYTENVISTFWKKYNWVFTYWALMVNGHAAGYLIIAERPGQAARRVLEIAVRGGDVDATVKLLKAARSAELPTVLSSTANSLGAAAARRIGIENPPREKLGSASIVKILDIESIGRKIWTAVPKMEDVEVRIWTPEREGVLHRPFRSPTRTIVIELKEDMLSRLLTRRLDISLAIGEDRITLAGDCFGDVESLTMALTPVPWAYHEIDGQ